MGLLPVEDSRRLQRWTAAALTKAGYGVDVASDGEDGLWLASSNDYDAVTLDIMLPRLDGLSVLERLPEGGH